MTKAAHAVLFGRRLRQLKGAVREELKRQRRKSKRMDAVLVLYLGDAESPLCVSPRCLSDVSFSFCASFVVAAARCLLGVFAAATSERPRLALNTVYISPN